jgi:hypothetical protein
MNIGYKLTLLLIAVANISGCGSVNPRIIESKEAGGVIQVDSIFNSVPPVIQVARAYCQSKGLIGPKDGIPISDPLYPRSWDFINWNKRDTLTDEERMRFNFRCEKPAPLPVVQQVIQPQNQVIAPSSSNTDLKAQIGEAKAKCADLGFKANTEAFGKCVLKLTN